MADNDLTGQQPDGTAPAVPEKIVSVQEGATGPLVADREAPVAAVDDTDNDDAALSTGAAPSEPRKPVEKLPDWAQKKMNELAAAEREARRKAKELEAELAKKDAPVQAAPSAADAAVASAKAPDGGYGSMADFNTAVQAEADRRAQAANQHRQDAAFRQKLDAAWTTGVQRFGNDDFATVANNLGTVGFVPLVDDAGRIVANTELMELVLDTDDPAQVLYEIGRDPNKAQEIMRLSPSRRAIEIAKLAVGTPKKSPEPLSKAPAPIRPVEGTARVGGEPRDDDDDQTWIKKRLAQRRERIRA